MGKGVKTLFKEASKETLAEKLAVIKEPLKIIADFSPEIDGAKACIFDVNGVEIIFAVNMKDKGYNFHLVDNDENLRLDNVVKEMFSVVKGAMCYALFAENTLIVDCLMTVINEITGKEFDVVKDLTLKTTKEKDENNDQHLKKH